jgi:hypothetical protein
VEPATAADTPRRKPRPARAKRAKPIDFRCPPMQVRHRATGVVTNWSTLFKRRVNEFEPFFRPGTDDEFIYGLRRRKFEAKMAERNGDIYVGSNARNSAFAEDEFDGDEDFG